MASLSVDLPADVKKEAVKTSGVVRCDKQVEVVLRNSKIEWNWRAKTSCSVAGASVCACVVGF